MYISIIMKRILLLFLLFSFTSYSQETLPYVNNFNNVNALTGWNHYAISGTDDWEHGLASLETNLNNLAWETKLRGTPTTSSVRVLESPSFDLTNAALPYVLSFKHTSNINSSNFYLDYSINNGITWQLFNPTTTLKKNWQFGSGFSYSSSGYSTVSAIDLSSLQGNPNVKFRFRFVTNSYCNGFGWVIDDFSVAPEYYNIWASQGNTIEISPLCPEIKVVSTLNFSNQYTSFFNVTTKYYLSTDTVLDAGDTYLDEKASNIAGTISGWEKIIPTPSSLTPGQYYILYVHDFNNTVNENNESDNVSYASLKVKPIYNLPFFDDFESNQQNWIAKQHSASTIPMIWGLGKGTRHHIEGTHSGNYAWHTSGTINENIPEYTNQWVESSYFNLSSLTDQLYLSFWFKDHYDSGVGYYDNFYKVQYISGCGDYWQDLFTIPENSSDEWEFVNIPIPAAMASSQNIRFRITFQSNYLKPEGIIFDDLYIGPAKADLTIERIEFNNRFTSSQQASGEIKYYLTNSGKVNTGVSSTSFYWSSDQNLDASDVLLGQQTYTDITAETGQWEQFTFTKPTQQAGEYYIIYSLDAGNQVDEIFETNNVGFIKIEQTPTQDFPYFNDFETHAQHWNHDKSLGNDDWALAIPNGQNLSTAFSGTKAWITNANGILSSLSRMHLYTPVFDLSQSVNPVLEFDMDTHARHYRTGAINLSYSIDNGATWQVLMPINESYTKWSKSMKYDENSGLDVNYMQFGTELMFSSGESVLSTQLDYNSRDVDRNTHYAINIPQLKDYENIRFRFNVTKFDNANDNYPDYASEGFLLDNFSISEARIDLAVPYSKDLYVSSLSDYINFSIDIKNNGNYISNATDIKFYLSSDANLDASDYLLGTSQVPQIRPEFKHYKSLEYSVPANFSTYSYLFYVIDGDNLNPESIETNNIGFWDLKLSGVNVFPYQENFEGAVINGWHGYSYEDRYSQFLDNYRTTTRIPQAIEENLYKRIYNGVLRTEYVPYGSWQSSQTPMYYIQSPVFDFTGQTQPLFMAFDYMCIGRSYYNGGNMEYSTDGGTTWNLITTASGPSINWYPNFQTMSELNNEPGWFDLSGKIVTAKMDISFLQNLSNVVFRFKYYSNMASSANANRGFRLDNFVIGDETAVDGFSCLEEAPYVFNFEMFDQTCWEITDNDLTILTERSGSMNWEIVDNFANVLNNKSAKIDIIGSGDTEGVWMISPKFQMIADNKLKFRIALTQVGNTNAATMDADDRVVLYYSTNNGLTWSFFQEWNSYTPISNLGQMINFDYLPSSGHVRFAFWATNGTMNDNMSTTFYVDDFELYNDTLGVNDFNQTGLNYYPNPVTDVLNINSVTGSLLTKIEVYNVSGQLLMTELPNAADFGMNMSGLSAGVYFVTVKSEEGIKRFKVVKK